MTSAGELACDGLRIAFERHADRIRHRVECALGDRMICLLESVEGTHDENWPASPALQEVHFESRPGGKQVALAVGKAGNSHWSLSVELDRATGRACWDVACRLKEAPARLGSEYRVLHLASSSERDLLAGGLTWSLGEGRRVGLHVPREGARLLVPDSQRLLIEREIATTSWPLTVRWGYTISLGTDSRIT